MYAFGRSAARLLTSKPSSFVAVSRTYVSFATPSKRIVKSAPVFQPHRRWATTESQEGEGRLRAEPAQQSAPAVAESANLTEATEEAIPAAEINERPSFSEGITAEGFSGTQTSPTDGGPVGFGADSAAAKKPTIYIGNLFFDVTEADLVKEFTRFGTIVRCKVVRDSRGLSKGFAYVDFSDAEAAEEAIRSMNLQLYEGRRMTVQFAARSSFDNQAREQERTPRKLNPPSKTLFIGNISFEMTDRDLSNMFRTIRNVIDVRVAIDRRTGQPRGFAHADFLDIKSASEAMKVLQDKETYGRRLRVDYSYSSSQSPRNAHGTSRGNQGPAEEF